jgi:hypothetical protein
MTIGGLPGFSIVHDSSTGCVVCRGSSPGLWVKMWMTVGAGRGRRDPTPEVCTDELDYINSTPA